VNDDLEEVIGRVPGPRTAELLPALRERESRNVTYLADNFPVFWEFASGSTVTDVDGNRFIDLTAAFGVANIGHANPYVASAISDQASRLLHGMGDVHPTEVKVKLLERLPHILPPGLDKTFLATTGSEAVEAALKTAIIATGKTAFAAYRNSYHGMSLGALAVTGIEKFRTPFAGAVANTTLWLDYPRTGNDVEHSARAALATAREELTKRSDLAALIIEPIQGRGGIIVPPLNYLSGLRGLCDELGILLIFDEIFTGFGRTGHWFSAIYDNVVPDIICIGKAMGSGFPISAAVARADIMDAWPQTAGEALHTSTYLGNPMGCAAALTTINEMTRMKLPARAHQLGLGLSSRLAAMRRYESVKDVRGRGLMWGIELADAATAQRVVTQALAQGVILLQAGPDGNVLSITPPLVITERQLYRAMDIVQGLL
jgi:4-aminobutyrate aminotransferase-like enzyme